SLRLVGGPTCNKGRLEVLHDDIWGTVCNDYFSDNDAALFCRAMGKPYGNAEAIATFGGGYGVIHLDDVRCSGQRDWRSCSHNGWGLNNCGHEEDVGLHCH
ncbi:hypothetical protein CAPTEDRAFT_107246, partial [Capitella teleta]